MTLGVKYRIISYRSLPQITVSWQLVFKSDLLGIQTLKFSRIQCPPNGRSKSHFEEAGSSGLRFISILFPEFSTKRNMRWMKYDPFTDQVGLFFVQLNACSLPHWKESPNWNVFVEPWYDELCEEWWIGHGSWFLVEGKIVTLDLLQLLYRWLCFCCFLWFLVVRSLGSDLKGLESALEMVELPCLFPSSAKEFRPH